MNTPIQNLLNLMYNSKIVPDFKDRIFLKKSALQRLIEKNIFFTFIFFFGVYVTIWNQTIPDITASADLSKFKLISLICGISVYSFLLLRLVILTILGIQVSYRIILRNAAFAIALSFLFLMYFEKSFSMVVTGELFCFGVCTFTVLESGYLIHFRNFKKEYYSLLPILGGIGVGTLLNLTGTLLYNVYWNNVSYYTFMFSIFILYLLKRRIKTQNETNAPKPILNPEIQEIIEQPNSNILESNEYAAEEKNLLKEDDLKRAEERIKGFIQEKLYADDSIRLIDLSAYLGISLHQASFYLNNHKNIGFSDFINQNRINDAIRLLLDKRNMNLLDIAFECGFNSYTSFHRACKKWTGYSPKGLRKNTFLTNESQNEHLKVLSINPQKVEILSAQF